MDASIALADDYARTAALPADVAGLTLIAIALGLDLLVGGFAWIADWRLHPRRWVDPLARGLNAAAVRSHGVWIGAGWTILALIFAIALGYAVSALAWSAPWGWAIEALAIFALIRFSDPVARIRRVRRALRRRARPAAEAALRGFVIRDLGRLDDHGVGRAAVERAARAFAEDGVGALFWYGLAGLPGLFAFAAVNRMNALSGYRADGYEDAAFALRRLAAALNFIPARIAGLILALAVVFAPDGRMGAALRAIPRHARKHRTPAAGWTQAALAGGLDLALGGRRIYDVEIVNEGWIGDGRAQLTTADLTRSAWALAAAGLLTAVFAVVIALGRAATL